MLEWVLKLLFMFVASQEHLNCVYLVCSRRNFILIVVRATHSSKNVKLISPLYCLFSLVQHESNIDSLTGIFVRLSTHRDPS